MSDADRIPRHYVIAGTPEEAREACENLGIAPSASTTVLVGEVDLTKLKILEQDTICWVRAWGKHPFAGDISRAVMRNVMRLSHSPEQREVSIG